VHLGGSTCATNFFCQYTKVHHFIRPMWEECGVEEEGDDVLFIFSLCRSIQDIFAIEVESCQK